MKISNLFYNFDWFTSLVFLFLILFFGGIGTAVTCSIYQQHKLETEFPIGSAVQLKGLNIKGNVSKIEGDNVTILVTDSFGELQTVTADVKLLTK